MELFGGCFVFFRFRGVNLFLFSMFFFFNGFSMFSRVSLRLVQQFFLPSFLKQFLGMVGGYAFSLGKGFWFKAGFAGGMASLTFWGLPFT